MAKIAKQMPEGRTLRGQSPFAQYLDGQAWELEPGTDFDPARMESMERPIRQLAHYRGLLVSVIRRDGKLYVQARPKVAQTEARVRVAK